jgi:hypothetical protein
MNHIAIALVSLVAANDMSGAAAAVAGGDVLFVGTMVIFGIVVGVVWLLFPFVIFSKLNKMILALDILNHNVRVLAKEADQRADQRAAGAGPRPQTKIENP